MTAEERALEAYPIVMSQYSDSCKEYDSNKSDRLIFIEGYHQAEKDLELTWEDIRLIDSIGSQFSFETGEWPYRKEHYKEVLKRFREMKEK